MNTQSPILKILRLDLLSLRPYLTVKNLLIFLALQGWYAYFIKNPAAVFGVSLWFWVMYSSYPFLVGDRSGIDSLYRLAGIRAPQVVLGRYLYALLIHLGGTCAALCLTLPFSLILPGYGAAPLLPIALGSALGGLLLSSLQFPFLFRYGYAKSKAVSGLTMFGVVALIFALSSLVRGLPSFTFPPALLLALAALLPLGLLALSLRLSLRWYAEKDLA